MPLAYVNIAIGDNDASASTLATSTGINVSAGNLLVGIVIWFGGTRTVSNITDTAGNTWVQCPGALNTSDPVGDRIDIWYCENAKAQVGNIATFQLSGPATFRRLAVLQYSGAATSGAFDVAAPGYASSGTTVTSGNLITSQANEVIVAGTSSDNTQTYTAGSGFTLRGTSISSDSRVEDRIVSAQGTYTASFTGTNNTVFYMSAAAFKEASAPPANPTAVSAWLTA